MSKSKSKKKTIDHDQLFKQLLTTFFLEFLELFTPEFFSAIDPNSLEILPQEYFTEIEVGDRKAMDSMAGLIRTVVLPSWKFSSSSGSKRAISPFGDGWYLTLSFPLWMCRSRVRVVTPKYSAACFLSSIV